MDMAPLRLLQEKYQNIILHEVTFGALATWQGNPVPGPATDSSGNKVWCELGEAPSQIPVPGLPSSFRKHRLDGPAFTTPEGYRAWWVHGARHRLDGPAVEDDEDGEKEWWINGKEYSEREFHEYIKGIKAREDILNKDNPGIEMDI